MRTVSFLPNSYRLIRALSSQPLLILRETLLHRIAVLVLDCDQAILTVIRIHRGHAVRQRPGEPSPSGTSCFLLKSGISKGIIARSGESENSLAQEALLARLEFLDTVVIRIHHVHAAPTIHGNSVGVSKLAMVGSVAAPHTNERAAGGEFLNAVVSRVDHVEIPQSIQRGLSNSPSAAPRFSTGQGNKPILVVGCAEPQGDASSSPPLRA